MANVIDEARLELESWKQHNSIPEKDDLVLCVLLTAALFDGAMSDSELQAVAGAINSLGLKTTPLDFDFHTALLKRLGNPLNIVLLASDSLAEAERYSLFEQILVIGAAGISDGADSSAALTFAGLCRLAFGMDEKQVANITEKLIRNNTGEAHLDRQDEKDFKNEASDGSCFIATAAWASREALEVRQLRYLRDHWLLRVPGGPFLVRLYYRISPAAAKVIKRSAILRVIVRKLLAPVVGISRILKRYEERRDSAAQTVS